MMFSSTSHPNGYVVITTLVFVGVFVLILYSLLGVVFTQYERQRQIQRSKESLQIAEAGLDWYRWYLAHNPQDLDGPQDSMPYDKEVTDPERGPVGTAKLNVSGNEFCGKVQSVDIKSSGWTDDDPDVTRDIRARYTRPSVAQYSYILNSNVWAGSDREINGPYHSNGGIRMDGVTNSTVSSAQKDWECTDSFGCDSGGETKPGVFGSGDNDELWKFPVPSIDFSGITLDLNDIHDKAKKDGLFFGSFGSPSNRHGWHVTFRGDGTVDVYRVKNTDSVFAYSSQQGWHRNYNIIQDEKLEGNYELPENCPVIYAEDKLWIDGSVDRKVTIAAAKTQNSNFDTDIVINDSLTYEDSDDRPAGLTAVAEQSISIPLQSPDQMKTNGVFIAQEGHFGRDHYDEYYLTSNQETYIKREQLTVNGTVVSNDRVGTKWVDDNDNYISGYSERINSYDRDQAINPPPLTPFVSEDYELIRWQEIER